MFHLSYIIICCCIAIQCYVQMSTMFTFSILIITATTTTTNIIREFLLCGLYSGRTKTITYSKCIPHGHIHFTKVEKKPFLHNTREEQEEEENLFKEEKKTCSM